jgi:hypothetical protein
MALKTGNGARETAMFSGVSPTPALPPCFRMSEEGRFLLCLRQGFEQPLRDMLTPLDTLWRRLENATPVARGKGFVVVWPVRGRDERVVLRQYVHGGALAWLLGRRLAGPERPLRELAVTEYVREARVSAPLALGAVVERRGWASWRAAMMTAEVPGAEDLVHFCFRVHEDPTPATMRLKRQVLVEAARQVRMLHDAGIEHADLHLKNLLVCFDAAGRPRVSVIDLDRARVRDQASERYRLRNLQRLARSARKWRAAAAVLTRADLLRFLRAYLGGDADRGRLISWAARLSGRGWRHDLWWRLSGVDRDRRGDRLGPPSIHIP